eukprot:scaffold34329_cov60-Phaeocystis_antarctica.AAC.3
MHVKKETRVVRLDLGWWNVTPRAASRARRTGRARRAPGERGLRLPRTRAQVGQLYASVER